MHHRHPTVTPQSQYRRGFWGIGDDGDDLSLLFR